MNDRNQAPAASDDEDLKRKLVWRMAFAGLLIAMLLAALAFFDYLGSPSEEPVASGPTFTSPVPVPKKEVSLPVKPAEPAVPSEPAKEAAAATPEAPTVAVPAQPERPEVPAQPGLPRSETHAARPAPKAVATPVEGTSSAPHYVPVPDKAPAPPAAAAAPAPAPAPAAAPMTAAPAPERLPPSPPRLFSGYAVQAGVFADAQHAEELRAKLTLNGIPSTIEARVQVGPFKTREEAEAARQKLRALGIDGVLLPPRGKH